MLVCQQVSSGMQFAVFRRTLRFSSSGLLFSSVATATEDFDFHISYL